MLIRFVRALLFLLILSIAGWSQRPVSLPTPADDVVKITTNLVQFDTIVIDKDGKQVTGLTADDFVVLQDGKPQKITGFSYVSTDLSPTGQTVKPQNKVDKNVALPPPVRSRPAENSRILTFVVNNGSCKATPLGVIASRDALEKFVNEQMASTDIVAIYQTRTGSSLLQQYTSDKMRLLSTISKIRWYPNGGCFIEEGLASLDPTPASPNAIPNMRVGEADTLRRMRDSSESDDVIGALGILRYIVRGLERVPGRKVVFLLSNDMYYAGRNDRSQQLLDGYKELVEAANRASVAFNTVDARGVFYPGLSQANAQTSNLADGPYLGRPVPSPGILLMESRTGLVFLAKETGGQFFFDQNFLDVPIRRALALEKGYYLLAYEPDEGTFKGKNFNRIEIKLNRPGLQVLSRAGFIGSVAGSVPRKLRTADTELYEAIVAPLPTAGLSLRLTAFFGDHPDGGNFVRSLIHLNGAEITFVNEPQGLMKAVFDVVAVTMNEKNEVVDEFTRTHTFKIEAAAMPLIRQNGLVYTTDVPIRKHGTYDFRVAVRDASSRTLGSASQVVQIPDLKKRKLALSALTVTQVAANGKFSIPSGVKPENALSLNITNAHPAIRRFRRGSILAYAYTIYNARLDNAAGKPSLTVQMNLYRDGKLILEGKPLPAELENQADWSRISDYAYFRLLPDAEAGDYALQVIVKDLLAKDNQVSSQWIDFEVEG